MTYSSTRPLITCSTSNTNFRERIHCAAERLRADFWAAPDINSTLEKCTTRQSSCIVVDYENAEWTAHINKLQHVTLLAVVPEGDVRAAFRAAQFGALNVMEKPLSFDELMVNLQSVLESESKFEEFLSSGVRFESQSFKLFSEREKAILSLLMEGQQNKRVAARLDIGLRTVEKSRALIMKKLGVSSFVELIKLVSSLERDYASAKNEIFAKTLSQVRSKSA